jgi:hypothetical protein
MNAPGDSLEFREGTAFRRLDRQVPGLGDAIRASYAERPAILTPVNAVLRKGEIGFMGRDFEFLLCRRGPTKVYLIGRQRSSMAWGYLRST